MCSGGLWGLFPCFAITVLWDCPSVEAELHVWLLFQGEPLPAAVVELVRNSPISSIEDLQLLLLTDSVGKDLHVLILHPHWDVSPERHINVGEHPWNRSHFNTYINTLLVSEWKHSEQHGEAVNISWKWGSFRCTPVRVGPPPAEHKIVQISTGRIFWH